MARRDEPPVPPEISEMLDQEKKRNIKGGYLYITNKLIFDEKERVIYFPHNSHFKNIEEAKDNSDIIYKYRNIIELITESNLWTYEKCEWENIGGEILNDIFDLLNKRSTGSYNHDYDVVRFVEKWGPMWKCRAHSLCYINQGGGDYEGECFWKPFEAIEDYLSLFKFFKFIALFKMSVSLPISREEIESQKPDLPEYNEEMDAMLRLLAISDENTGRAFSLWYFSRLFLYKNHFNLFFSIDLGTSPFPTFKPTWNMGLGFARIAWFTLFKAIYNDGEGDSDLSICSKCLSPYFRIGRRQKQGQKNYCEKCRRGKKNEA